MGIMDQELFSITLIAQIANNVCQLSNVLHLIKKFKKVLKLRKLLSKKPWKGQSLKIWIKNQGLKRLVIHIIKICRNSRWPLFPIMNVSNAKTHTMEDVKHVIKPVTITPTLRKKNLSAVNVPPLPSVVVKRPAKLMEQISSNTNANSAVKYHNGSVGVTHISVNCVIRNNVQEITYLERVKTSLTNALVQRNVLLKSSIRQMEKSTD